MKPLAMQKTILALSLVMLSACADFNAGWNGTPNQYTNDPYTQSDFDELLAFGANMANIPPSSRTEVCRILLQRQNGSPAPGVWLHLMIGRLLSDSCGDIPKILDGLSAIPPGSLSDQPLQKLVDIHTETLKRMNTVVSRKSGSISRKQKAAKSVQDSKDSSESRNDENRLLREKLEAIRSMEKHLDESDNGN